MLKTLDPRDIGSRHLCQRLSPWRWTLFWGAMLHQLSLQAKITFQESKMRSRSLQARLWRLANWRSLPKHWISSKLWPLKGKLCRASSKIRPLFLIKAGPITLYWIRHLRVAEFHSSIRQDSSIVRLIWTEMHCRGHNHPASTSRNLNISLWRRQTMEHRWSSFLEMQKSHNCVPH